MVNFIKYQGLVVVSSEIPDNIVNWELKKKKQLHDEGEEKKI